MFDRDRQKPLCDSTLWCRPRTCDPQILARRRNSKQYPLHTWYVDVLLDIAGGPDYRGRFPIKVEG